MTKTPALSAEIIQAFDDLAPARLGLADEVRRASVAALNGLLAHTMALRDLYKKAHWQTYGPNFYELHLLFDKHYGEQVEIMDATAERIQAMGGVALATAFDVVAESRIPAPPRDREAVQPQLRRLLAAHEITLRDARPLAQAAAARGDDGTSDLIVSQLIRVHEMESWFVSEHLFARDTEATAVACSPHGPGATL
jgi:starvation-inducible DNA-binding protein